VIRVAAQPGEALLASLGLARDGREPGRGALAGRRAPGGTAGLTASISISGRERRFTARNVIGTIPGSDPALREQAIVVGAHLDHLGESGGRYYPGADDNASGVAALLEMARAFAAGATKPRRTIVFAFWTGEEEGHLGSEHYARHPAWPLDRTPVYLNLDMIAHPWTKAEIEKLVADTGLPKGDEFLARVQPADFVELGVSDWSPDVAAVLARAARGTGLALRLDRTDGKSGGSDYREFARRGLPWVRFFGNYFDGYHEPTDTVEKLDAGQVLKMARLAFASAWLLADR
jgi:Zn-dependent M28 family amino/carboxypeptidase